MCEGESTKIMRFSLFLLPLYAFGILLLFSILLLLQLLNARPLLQLEAFMLRKKSDYSL